jgi:hypothetical protein
MVDNLHSMNDIAFYQLLVGIIEGDGCVCITKHNRLILTIDGHHDLLMWIAARLVAAGFRQRKVIRGKSDFSHTIRFGATDCLKLVRLLFKSEYHLLTRKWAKINRYQDQYYMYSVK